SLRTGWLFLLVASFGFFFWDGILGYLPAAREMRSYWSIPLHERPKRFVRLRRDCVLALHFLSFPVVLAFGVLKLPTANPFAGTVQHIEESLRFLHSGLPQAIVAVLVWLLMGGVVFLCRWIVAILD